MAEQTIYSDQYVTITTARIMISGTTYALRNITSVRMTYKPADKGCAMTLLVIGIFCVFGAFGMMADNGSDALLSLFFGALILTVAIFWIRSIKALYHVTIASSSGESNALTSLDKNYIEGVVGSINQAIVRYRE